jgi:hypothetical protein
MPIKFNGKKFDKFKELVKHLKRTRPSIRKPEAFVATIERKQKGKK